MRQGDYMKEEIYKNLNRFSTCPTSDHLWQVNLKTGDHVSFIRARYCFLSGLGTFFESLTCTDDNDNLVSITFLGLIKSVEEVTTKGEQIKMMWTHEKGMIE